MDSPEHFADRLVAAIRAKRSPVLVGLDPRADLLPQALRPVSDGFGDVASSYREFCCGVIDAVAPWVAIVKPQIAFFEQLGPAGMQVLAEIIDYAHQNDLLVVVDAKRNDIGTTAEAYANAYLGPNSPWKGDALTINPYLGDDSLTPFVERNVRYGTGSFVLVKTSNPGGKRWQDLTCDGTKIYQHVADHVESLARSHQGISGYGSVGAVVGATYPQELEELRSRMPTTWLLVPGYGSQGGTARDVAAAFDAHGLGAIINNSRGIIFAHRRPEFQAWGESNWQRAVEEATRLMTAELHDVMQ